MNQTPPSPDHRWDDLVRRARADLPPRIDVSATLRALRTAAPEQTGWLADFTALFATRHAIRTCLFAATTFALMAGWEAWNLWQVLPWAQLLAPAPGGLL